MDHATNSDAKQNQNDSIDEYMRTLVEKPAQKLNNDEVYFNHNENESHLEEFYTILSENKKREEEKRDPSPQKTAKHELPKSIAPSLASNELSTKPYVKDMYVVDDEVNNMSLEQSVNFKKKFSIETFGTRVPKPISSFLHLSNSLPKTILARIDKMGFYEPTPVQCQAIPCILQGRNTIILSETGSGKTLSYLIPLVAQILNLIKQWKSVATKKTVYAIILTLTRELCHQIYTLVQKLCKNINLRIVLVSTGVDKTELFKSVLNGCELAICTPARLVDLISLKGLNLSDCKYFVLDESDKMFTSDYQTHTLSVLNLLRDDTLMVFVSASTTDEILKKIKSLVRNAITVKVGASEVINLENIDLKFMMMFSNNNLIQKKTWLADNIPSLEANSKTIIFCNSRQTVEHLYSFLSSTAKTCCMVYGDMPPTERHNIIGYFKKGYFKTLIATDLVCRGIDIPTVGCVVNYDTPKHFHTFLHRVGRCGRANSKGVSYTLFSKQDNKIAAFIAHYMESVAKKSSLKLEVPEHLKKFALTFGPYKNSKRLGMDFLEYMSRGTLLKESSKANKMKRPLGKASNNTFVPVKQAKTFSSEPVASHSYDEATPAGREYNATDEISSSSDDENTFNNLQ